MTARNFFDPEPPFKSGVEWPAPVFPGLHPNKSAAIRLARSLRIDAEILACVIEAKPLVLANALAAYTATPFPPAT